MNGTHLAAVGAPGSGSTPAPVPSTDDVQTTGGRPALRLAPALPEPPAPPPHPVDRPRRRGDLDEAWPSAASDFTPWLVGHLDVLGDAMGVHLTVAETDVTADGFRYDIAARDVDGRVIVITNQLEGTDLARLGDCLAAAAGLNAAAVVWVSRHLGDDIRHAFDWLNDRGDQPIRFFGVEVDVALAADTGPHVPFVEVIARPADWADDPASHRWRDWGVGETPENRARQDLFREVLLAVGTSRPSVRIPARNTDRSWLDFAAGAFGSWGLAQVDDGRIRVEARLDTGDRARSTSLFDLVRPKQEEWSRSAGLELAFEGGGARRVNRIAVHHPPVDLLALSPDQHDALVVWLVRSVVALYDTLDVTLRGRAQLMQDLSRTRGR
ncbi:hypothetical protein [Oryzobacter telluris]|uniref:hypothetical protein n=1 Tax=Oryzobacter telluris TaxID=3149179 RepID=UPI00370D60B6